MKYYAVKNGREVGIFNSWDECKKQVEGFSNAQYKSFKSLEDANTYLYGLGGEEGGETNIKAYVDGSFNGKTKTCGYGLVIIKEGMEIEKSGSCKEYSDHRNVTGEIIASMKAMEYGLKEGVPEISIYYDYEGIRSWALGLWKTNKELTQKYKKYYDDNVRDKLKVNFIKVKAHSGNKYNEIADSLAKKACGIG